MVDRFDKRSLSERDICTKYITPAIVGAGWDVQSQIREEFTFTAGRIIVQGKKVARGEAKRADYILYFKPFESAMTKITNRQIDKSYEIYLSLYQAVTGTEEESNIYKEFSPNFFDMVIVDECHRGSAVEDSAWREVLKYFSSATQIGMTATPKETKDVSNIEYFGEPIYTYSLRQGIEDGFLAPYKVVRIDIDKDLTGWRPPQGKVDKYGRPVEDRIYNQSNFDRTLILEKRTELVAKKIAEFLKLTDRYDKTIVFCEDIDHAERMRQALVNENADLVAENAKYIMRITGDDNEGKRELEDRGIFLEALAEEIGKDYDAFDLLCHVAWGQPALTRRERAENVRKRDYFTQYGETARQVLNALLDKYADEGIVHIEDLGILNVSPIRDMGTPIEIITAFGGRERYLQALHELEMQLYAA